MAAEQGSLLGARTFTVVSVVGAVVGSLLIVFGDATLTTGGVLLIILSAVSLLFAVGSYLADVEIE